MAESISGLASIVVRESPQVAVGNSPVLVKAGAGNLYGFLIENEGGSAVFMHFFDAASAGDVTLGVTVPKFIHGMVANADFGRDPVNVPYDHFALGLVVAITSTRAGVADPGYTVPTKFWYQKQP